MFFVAQRKKARNLGSHFFGSIDLVNLHCSILVPYTSTQERQLTHHYITSTTFLCRSVKPAQLNQEAIFFIDRSNYSISKGIFYGIYMAWYFKRYFWHETHNINYTALLLPTLYFTCFFIFYLVIFQKNV